MNLPAPPAIGLLPWLGAQETQNAPFRGPNDGFLGDRPLGFVGRTLTGLLLLGLFVAGAAAIAAFRPRWTGEVQGTLASQAALSFAAGLIANVLMLAVIGFLYITICLRPPALLLAVGLLAFNVAGMAAVGAEIGGRLSERLRGTWTPTSRTALGVAAPGAIIVFLWAVGGCFGFFGNMGALLLGSFGVGAILVKALNLGAKAPTSPAAPTDSPAAPRAPATAPTTPSAPATSDSSSMPPVAPAAAAAPVATTLSETTPSAAASSDSSPLPPVAPAATVATDAAATAAAAAASEPAAPAAGTPSDTPPADTRAADVWAADAPASEAAAAAAPLGNAEPWWVDAGQLAGSAPAQEGSPAAPPAASPAAPAGSPAGPVAVDTDAALSAVAGMSAAGGQADFTGIEGIGPKLNQRLHAANIHTFADLASLPPETLAGILGWTSERLLRSGIVEQARRLA
jgi:predicted flap endonuclease-1-like 5' DNA nuclease